MPSSARGQFVDLCVATRSVFLEEHDIGAQASCRRAAQIGCEFFSGLAHEADVRCLVTGCRIGLRRGMAKTLATQNDVRSSTRAQHSAYKSIPRALKAAPWQEESNPESHFAEVGCDSFFALVSSSSR